MRTCPACQRGYDSQKSFCVYDGQPLVDSQASDPFVDRIVDNKYSIDYKIAEGGTGTVYRATHLQLQSVVAIKIMRPALTNDAVAIERFRREAYAAMRVRHPNAVAVLDFGITDDRLVYVVMELLIGQSLSDRMKARDVMPIAEANHIMQQVCAAVSVAHARGIVHRDLKPENIFLHQEDGQETVKVLDFGIAKVQDFSFTDEQGNDLTGAGAVVGTPYYISPEQCSGQPVDARSDVYSLGIVLYQMLTGKLPFDGASSIIVLLKQLNDTPPPIHQVRPELPQLLNAVVMHALEKDPRSRPQSVTSFANELGTVARALADREFKDIFFATTEKELEAAVLLANESTGRRPPTGSYSRPALLETNENDRPTGTVTGSLAQGRHTNTLPRSVQGHLSWFDLASIVYLLSGLRETGQLTLHNTELAPEFENIELVNPFARIYFEEGNIIRTKLGVRTGREAFFQLFQMPLEGCFLFKNVDMPAELANTEAITDEGSALIKEALGLKTLLSRFVLKFPDMLITFRRKAVDLNWRDSETEGLAQTIWQLLSNKGVTLSELLARSTCCNAKTYQVMATMLATRQVAAERTGAISEPLRPASAESI